jgi:hypothetical protein
VGAPPEGRRSGHFRENFAPGAIQADLADDLLVLDVIDPELAAFAGMFCDGLAVLTGDGNFHKVNLVCCTSNGVAAGARIRINHATSSIRFNSLIHMNFSMVESQIADMRWLTDLAVFLPMADCLRAVSDLVGSEYVRAAAQTMSRELGEQQDHPRRRAGSPCLWWSAATATQEPCSRRKFPCDYACQPIDFMW